MHASFFVRRALLGAGGALCLTLASCGSSSSGSGDAQTPPEGETAVKAWLATGDYKSWHCQPAEHAARAPSPHGFNRICSNDVLSAGSKPFPEGSAAVKELWSGIGGKIVGYAVYLKTAADSAAGANWYWYEDDPTFNPPNGVVADGMGNAGTPLTICVSCHTAAGSDAEHVGPGDFVYTQVK
jgi:hypothetical protein